MKIQRILTACFLCLVLAAGNGFAQDADSSDAFDLGEIVVTGKSMGIDDVAITTKMTAEEIEATNSNTVAQALRFAPGIMVTRGNKNEPEISVHGFSSEKTLFLIDGIPYYETNYGKLSLDQIPVEVVSRIEVTKNAPSVLYGPNAEIAVINVITKKGTQEPSFGFNGEIGEDETYRAALSHGNQVGPVNYWISYVHEQSDGWRLSDDFEPTRFEDGGLRENSDYNKNKLWARIGLTPSMDSEYFLSFHYLDSELGHLLNTNRARYFPRDGDEPAFSHFSRFGDYDDWGVDLSGKQSISDMLTFRGKLFYHNHEDVYLSYDGADYLEIAAQSTYKDDLIGTSLFSDFILADLHEGHVSFHLRRDNHDYRDDVYLPYNESASYTGSVGTEHAYHMVNGFTVYAGISYDWFDVNDAEEYQFDADTQLLSGQADLETPFESEVNPMVGFTWDLEPSDMTVYGSVARKSRFPTLSQLYSTTSGNTDLTSEKAINYTLGATKRLGSSVSVDFSGFYHDIGDWISRDYYTDEDDNDIYMNVEEISMIGFETAVTTVLSDYFKLNANYTYILAENESDISPTDKVSGVPKHKIGAGFNALVPVLRVSFDMQGIYVDEAYDDLPTPLDDDVEITKSDDYFIVNSRISKNILDYYSVYAEVDNIFDKDYEEEVGFPAPGRNFRAGLKMTF